LPERHISPPKKILGTIKHYTIFIGEYQVLFQKMWNLFLDYFTYFLLALVQCKQNSIFCQKKRILQERFAVLAIRCVP